MTTIPEDILPAEPERVRRVRELKGHGLGAGVTVDLAEVDGVDEAEVEARVRATLEVARNSPDALRIDAELAASTGAAERERLRVEKRALFATAARRAAKRASAHRVAVVHRDGVELLRVTQPAEWGPERLVETLAKMEIGS